MYRERQNWQRIRIRKGFPTGSHQRKFHLCTRINFFGNERQIELYTSNQRTYSHFWRKYPGNHRSGQGVLECEKPKRASTPREASTWITKTIDNKGGSQCGLKPTRAPPQSASWNRADNWSRETRRTIGTKQNEKRQGNFSLGLRVCPGIQYAPNDQIPTRKNKASVIKKREKRLKWRKERLGKHEGDPSVAEAPSGQGFGAFAPAPN